MCRRVHSIAGTERKVEVITMQEIKQKPNKHLIDMLERVLDRAKTGEIQGIAIAGAHYNAVTFNCFVSGG